MTVTCVFSGKGGQGCSTVAAAMLIAGGGGVLIDASPQGDVAALLGILEPSAGEVVSIGAAGPLYGVGAELVRVVELKSIVDLIGERHERGPVIIDAGTNLELVEQLAPMMGRTVLVTRACYLAARGAQRSSVRADVAVLLLEVGRALRASDMRAALGIGDVVELDVSPAVARAIDAGLLVARMPRELVSMARRVLDSAPAVFS